MKKPSVLADTSFLITLFDDSRMNHEVAKTYYRRFIEEDITIYISAIVVAEYSQKAPIDEIMETGNFTALSFSNEDGKLAGDVSKQLAEISRTGQRDAVKDDMKLIAQAERNEIKFIVTDDKSTLAKYCRILHSNGFCKLKAITSDKFDESVFPIFNTKEF